MPTASDLVTDLPADFEVFGQAVDTSLADLKGGTTGQVLKKNSNTDMDFVWGADSAGMTNPMTTTGDTIYSSSGSTPARLGIGSTGQILTVSGGLPVWSTPAGAAANFTLLSTTTLSGASTTISGISGQNTLMALVMDVELSSTNIDVRFRLNGDTGTNYAQIYTQATFASTYSANNFSNSYDFNGTAVEFARNGSVAAGRAVGAFTVFGANAAGAKPFVFNGGGRGGGGQDQRWMTGQGAYKGTSTISSVTLLTGSGTFIGGTVYLYGSSN